MMQGENEDRPGSPPAWRLILGLALGLVLLGLVAFRVDMRQVWLEMGRAQPFWVIAALVSVLLTTLAKVARWRGLFAEPRPGFWSLCRALLSGQFANAVLPARLGDVTRAYQLGAESGGSKAAALGTVAAEKGFDMLFLLLAAGLAALSNPLPSWLNLSLSILTALGLIAAILALAWPQQRLLAWMNRLGQHVPATGNCLSRLGARALGLFERMLGGLASLRSPRMALKACAWSAAIWTLSVLTNAALFRAFGFELGPGAAILLLVVLLAGSAPPSTPGKIGVFHYLTVLCLDAWGVARADGLAFAAVLYLIVFVPQIVPGALTLGAHLYVGQDRAKRQAQP